MLVGLEDGKKLTPESKSPSSSTFESSHKGEREFAKHWTGVYCWGKSDKGGDLVSYIRADTA